MSTTPIYAHESTWIWGITALTALMLFAGSNRLGLDHFDEGIYASTGTWILDKNGLASFDPGVIPYAPPVFPIAVGLSYSLLGVSDFAAVFPSILAGIALVALVGWFGNCWFGPGRGILCAGLACLSGASFAFSRMALTDATFALTWLLAISAGVWFLSKPGPGRAVIMGLAVGLAQLTKYNGWLTGAIVILAALAGVIFDKEQRSRTHLLTTFGWGTLGAVVAALVYLPWFRFVENHGGYSDLLRHQRSYLGTLSQWPSHLLTQLKQSTALQPPASLGVLLFPLWYFLNVKSNKQKTAQPKISLIGVLSGLAIAVTFGATWWSGLVLAPYFLTRKRPSERVLGAWWIALSLLTPLYHPYARLWLPLELCGWIMNGVFLAGLWDRHLKPAEAPKDATEFPSNRMFLAIGCVVCLGFAVDLLIAPRSHKLLETNRDSLRIATNQFANDFPPGITSARLLARPPLNFYLAPALARKGIALSRAASLQDLANQPGVISILDTVQLVQEIPDQSKRNAWLNQFEILVRTKNELSNVTLLDVDPAAATGDYRSRTQEILLLKRKAEMPQ